MIKKTIKKALSLIMAFAMLGTSAVAVSAEGEKSFFNDDHSINMNVVRETIDKNIASLYNGYDMEKYGLFEVNGFKFNCGREGISDSEAAIYEKMINNFFETETVEGKSYVILNGKPYAYYLGKETPENWPTNNNGKIVSGNYFCFVDPEIFAPYAADGCTGKLTRFMFTDTNGAFMKVNEDEFAYFEAVELCYDFYYLQEDSIIFRFLPSIVKAYNAGYFKETAVEDLTKEQIIRNLAYAHTKGAYYFSNSDKSIDDFAFDVDNNNTVDVKDLALVTKYLVKETDLTPTQKIVASVDESCEPDIRTVTKICRKIVGLE